MVMDNKSQAAPFLIAVLVVVLIMAFVTINIGRVGIFRADISNTVDAGALAGGSSMAYYFNEQCYLNDVAIQNYKSFVRLVDAYVNGGNSDGNYSGGKTSARGKAYYYYGGNGDIYGILPNLNDAQSACANHVSSDGSNTCEIDSACVSSAQEALDLLAELAGGNLDAADEASGGPPDNPPPDPAYPYVPGSTPRVIPDYQYKQWYLYNEMKEKSREGREYSIRLALRFAFLNSGIGGKIQPEAASAYKTFLFSLKDQLDIPDGNTAVTQEYEWRDDHYTSVTAETGLVNKYSVWVTRWERDKINGKLKAAKALMDEIADTAGSGKCCACCTQDAGDIQTKIDQVSDLLNEQVGKQGIMKLIRGNQAADIWIDPNFGKQLFAYTDDIFHDLSFTVSSEQQEGTDDRRDPLLLAPQYPLLESFATVDFEGNGEICESTGCNGTFEGNAHSVGEFRAKIIKVDE